MKAHSKSLFVIILISLACCTSPQKDLDKLKLVDLAGNDVDLTTYSNKRVFVNFWATWCKPCIQEMPTIAAAMEGVKEENIVFLFASNESLDLIENFKSKRGFDFHYVQAQNLEGLNIQALPTTFIYNTEGKLVFSEAGYRDWSTPENLFLITGKKE